MTSILDEAQVRQAIDMHAAIEAMEALCREEAAGQTVSAERIHMRLPRGFLRILPGVLTQTGVMGYKAFLSNGHGVRYAIHLFDFETGAPLAIMDASYVTAIRTGAMAAVALNYLSPGDATRVGVIGSGLEARSEMEALMAVRPGIRSGRIFSPRPERREAFAREVSATYGLDMTAVDTPQHAIDSAEIVLVATSTRGGGGGARRRLAPPRAAHQLDRIDRARAAGDRSRSVVAIGPRRPRHHAPAARVGRCHCGRKRRNAGPISNRRAAPGRGGECYRPRQSRPNHAVQVSRDGLARYRRGLAHLPAGARHRARLRDGRFSHGANARPVEVLQRSGMASAHARNDQQ